MDISSLLSSQEPHRNDARNAAIQSARAQQSRARSAKDSSLLQQATTSPLLHGITRSPDSPLRPSPILSPVSGINGSRTNYSPTPHQSPMSPPTYHPAVSSHEFTSPRAAHRNSLASMETLAGKRFDLPGNFTTIKSGSNRTLTNLFFYRSRYNATIPTSSTQHTTAT